MQLKKDCVHIVTFLNSQGRRIKGRLVSQNKKTALVKPYRWLKMPVIKIHKAKQQMEFTGEIL